MKKLSFPFTLLILIFLAACCPFTKSPTVREGTYLNNLFRINYNNYKGNKDAKVAVVQFFDYNCPDCRNFNPELNDLISKYGEKIKVIYIDYPKLGKISTFAAKSTIASAKQNKYLTAHNALLSSKERLQDEFVVIKSLEAAGINIKKLDKEINNHETDLILLNYMLEGNNQSIKNIPAFIIGNVNDLNNAKILVSPSKSKLESTIKNYLEQ